MVPVWMSFSDLFKVTIIQRQITWKWYNGRPIESRVWSIEQRHFQWPWTTPTPSFKVTPFFNTEYFINGTTYRHSFNEIPIGTYTPLPNSVISNDLEWLSKIFNDTNRRGLSATAELLVLSCYTSVYLTIAEAEQTFLTPWASKHVFGHHTTGSPARSRPIYATCNTCMQIS